MLTAAERSSTSGAKSLGPQAHLLWPLKLLSGSEMLEQIDPCGVSRLIHRSIIRPNAPCVTFIAATPEDEIELRQFRNESRILELLQARAGRTVEVERT
jgi:hypothetical protein